MTLNVLKQYLATSNIGLAHYVGTSSNTINSIVIGRRTYTADQAVAFTNLLRALELEVPLGELDGLEGIVEGDKESFREESSAMVRKLERTVEILEEKLQRHLTKREDYLRGWRMCEKMMVDSSLAPDQRQWLEKRQLHLAALLEEHSFSKVKQLEAKIIGLKAELEALEVG